MSLQQRYDAQTIKDKRHGTQQSGSEHSARLHRLLAQFTPVSLPEIERVALLDRAETKMLLTLDQLCDALQHLAGAYQILEIDGHRQHRYQTLYFDTPDFAFYRQHHAGHRDRYKVRERVYVDSNLAFVEVKHKTRVDRTIKHRRPVPEITAEFGAAAEAFIFSHAPYTAASLEPKLWNAFRRITLVNMQHKERFTVDLGLHFYRPGAGITLPDIAIAEIKQDRLSNTSDFLREMRYLGIRPTGFSKYCTGVALLYPEVKHNNFKPRLLHLNRLTRQEMDASFSSQTVFS